MNKRDFLNYCQLAFINGMNDAIAVIALHKVFVVLATGNIIFLITDLATHFSFKDWVRISLLINFVVAEITVHKYIAARTIGFKIGLAICLVLVYWLVGTTAVNLHHLSEYSFGFFIVANIAAIASIVINNIFYRFHRTKFNLMLYTMNLINLIHMLMEKRFSEAKMLIYTLVCFILGLVVASFTVTIWHFFAVLIIIPILIHLYFTNYLQSDNI